MAEYTKSTDAATPDELIKEEFNTKIDDAQLVTLINGWMVESKSYYDELRDVMDKNLQYYAGNQTEVGSVRGKNSKAVENRVFMGVETLAPIITAQPPDMICEPASDDELANIRAAKLQKALYYHYDRTNLKQKAERFMRDLILKRYGVMKLVWDGKTDDVDVKMIDPRRIYFCKYGSTVDEKPYVIEKLELSYKGVESLFDKATADKVLQSAPSTGESDELKKRKTTFCIYEVWTDDFRVWKFGDSILKKENNPFYDYKNLKKNYFDLPKKPYVIKSLFQTDETLVGETDLVCQTRSIQDNINKRKRQIENLSARVANPMLLIDSDVMDEETASTITNEEGLVLYGKDVAQPGKVRFEAPGQVPSYLFDDLMSSRNEFDNIFGTHSTTRGEKSGQKTLGQDVLARQADLGRIDMIKRRYDEAVGEVAEFWVQMMKIMYDTEKIIKIMGNDGELLNFSVEDIEDKAKIIVKSGTAIPTDEISLRQEAINLFQLGGLDPLTMYEKMKFPNPKETFARLAKFRSGQAFAEASGQGAMPGQSGVASSENLGQIAGAAGGVPSAAKVVQNAQV